MRKLYSREVKLPIDKISLCGDSTKQAEIDFSYKLTKSKMSLSFHLVFSHYKIGLESHQFRKKILFALEIELLFIIVLDILCKIEISIKKKMVPVKFQKVVFALKRRKNVWLTGSYLSRICLVHNSVAQENSNNWRRLDNRQSVSVCAGLHSLQVFSSRLGQHWPTRVYFTPRRIFHPPFFSLKQKI